jgi:hypothetical protein
MGSRVRTAGLFCFPLVVTEDVAKLPGSSGSASNNAAHAEPLIALVALFNGFDVHLKQLFQSSANRLADVVR